MARQASRHIRKRLFVTCWTTVLATAAVTASVGLPATASAAPSVMAQSLGAFRSGDATTVERAFSGAKYVGATRVRDVVEWDNNFSWSPTDAFVSNVVSHGLAPYLTLTYEPIENGGSRTVTVSDFANFCSSAATRYGTNVNDYGVFNEPNTLNFFWGDASPRPARPVQAVDYGALYRACYAAIKGVNPSARVYIGELANYKPDKTGEIRSACKYLENAVADTLTRADAVAIHPYQFYIHPNLQSPGPCVGIGRLNEWAAALPGMSNLKTPAGGTVPLAITEFGYCASPSADPCKEPGAPADEATRASWMTAALTRASTFGVRIFAQYHLVYPTGPEWNTGIMGNDGSVTAQMNSLRSFSGATWGAPGATTAPRPPRGSRSATLSAQVDAHGFAGTTYRFEYGTISNSLTSSTQVQDAGAAVSPTAVSTAITGLRPRTTYYFRVVAAGPGGVTTGAVQSFTTRGRIRSDYNGDGKDDLLAWNTNGQVAVALSNGSSFIQPTGYALNGPFWGTGKNLVADVTGDGRDDLVAWNTNGQVAVALSNGSSFIQPTGYALNGPFWGTGKNIVADVTGDGKEDLVAWNTNGQVAVAVSNGSSFIQPTGYWLQGPLWGTGENIVTDVTGDGKDDLVAWNTNGQVAVAVSNGSSFIQPTGYALNGPFWGTGRNVIRDVTGDGKDDLVAWNTNGQVAVAESNGNSFIQPAAYALNGPFWGTGENIVTDVTGDGKDDLVAWNTNGQVAVAVSNGNSFIQPTAYALNGPFWGTGRNVTKDFNGDGKDDLVAWNTNGQVAVAESNGSSFIQPAAYALNGPFWGTGHSG